jgi:hypothetical protein
MFPLTIFLTILLNFFYAFVSCKPNLLGILRKLSNDLYQILSFDLSLIFQDTFILDTVTSGIYVWIGKDSTTAEKVEGLKRGQAFLTNNNYPAWTKVREKSRKTFDFKFKYRWF